MALRFNNKPTFGPVYHNMCVCRDRFKYALRYTKHIEDFFDYGNEEYWKGFKKLNQCKNIQANCIRAKLMRKISPAIGKNIVVNCLTMMPLTKLKKITYG